MSPLEFDYRPFLKKVSSGQQEFHYLYDPFPISAEYVRLPGIFEHWTCRTVLDSSVNFMLCSANIFSNNKSNFIPPRNEHFYVLTDLNEGEADSSIHFLPENEK